MKQSFALSLVALSVCGLMMSPYVALAVDATLTDCTESELDTTGNHTNTACSAGTLTLDTGQTSGSYETPVLDAGSPTNWTNIAWTPSAPYNKALIASDESSYDAGNMNDSANAVVLLPLDEESGTYEDLTSNNNDATPTFSPTQGQAGRIGLAPDFNGSNQYLNIPDSASLDVTNVTLAAWVYADTLTEFKAIIDKRETGGNIIAYSLVLRADATLRFTVRNSGGTVTIDEISTGTVGIGAWHHVAVTYDGTDVDFYIDGQPAGTSTDASGLEQNNAAIRIGRTGTNSWEWDGRIDEVGVWNAALDASDIEALYDRGAKRLFIDFKTCDDAACSGETYTTTVSEQDNSSVSLPSVTVSETENQYAQAEIRFEADDASNQPELQDITFTYDAASTPEFGSLLAAALILAGGWYVSRRFGVFHKRPLQEV